LVLVLSSLIFLLLRTGLDYLHFDKYVWHRPLADACLFIITLGLLVLSISRGIADTNTSAGSQSLPNVDPIFTWVRLAQRIPVRIEIDHVPDSVVLAAGQTCTVVVESSRSTSGSRPIPL
jgi:hypothetical protein